MMPVSIMFVLYLFWLWKNVLFFKGCIITVAEFGVCFNIKKYRKEFWPGHQHFLNSPKFQLLEVPLNKVWQDADSELLSCPAFWSRFCSEAIDLIIKWWPILFFLSHYDINRPLHSIFDKVLSRTSKRVSIDNAEIRKRSKV